MTPLAYLLTFRSYGTWLPGDDRGSVDRRAHHRGSPMQPPNAALEQAMRRRLRHPPVHFCAPRRATSEAAIRQHCAHRGWVLLAVHVRTEHVHVVVATEGTADMAPGRMMTELKAWARRRMVQGQLLAEGIPAWSRHGSTRHIFTAEGGPEGVSVCRQGSGRAAAVGATGGEVLAGGSSRSSPLPRGRGAVWLAAGAGGTVWLAAGAGGTVWLAAGAGGRRRVSGWGRQQRSPAQPVHRFGHPRRPADIADCACRPPRRRQNQPPAAARPSQRRPPALPFGLASVPLGVRGDAVFTASDGALEEPDRFVSCRRPRTSCLQVLALKLLPTYPVLRKSR
jgi:REP element-mobilizing transposase RayT